MQLGMCCCPGSSSSGSSGSGSGSISNFITTSSACSTCSSNVTVVRYQLTVAKTSGTYPSSCWSEFEGVFYLEAIGSLTWFDDGQFRSRCTWRSTNQAKEIYTGSGCANVTSGPTQNLPGRMWQMYHSNGPLVSNGSGGFIHRNTLLVGYAASSSGGVAGNQLTAQMSQPNNAPPGSLTRNCLSSFDIAVNYGSWAMTFAIQPW